jgi:hypothetical protein
MTAGPETTIHRQGSHQGCQILPLGPTVLRLIRGYYDIAPRGSRMQEARI